MQIYNRKWIVNKKKQKNKQTNKQKKHIKKPDSINYSKYPAKKKMKKYYMIVSCQVQS